MVSKSTRIHYTTAPLIATERESLYENIMQYAPNILERTPATMALLSEPRSALAGGKVQSKRATKSIATKSIATDKEQDANDVASSTDAADVAPTIPTADGIDAPIANEALNGASATSANTINYTDPVNGDEDNSSSYAATIKYRDQQGNLIRKHVDIEHPYMLIFMQSYMNEYTNLVQRLLTNSNNREIVEQTLQEMLRSYHGLLMNEYRNLFYVMLYCAPKVLMLMLRFEFWRDLYLQKHDLVVDLDLHSQLRQTSEEYNQLVLDYQEYTLNAQRYIAKTKHFTIQEAARLKRLARYQRLKKQKKPIPKDLLQALSQDEQDLIDEERIRQLNEKQRLYAALKNDYQTILTQETEADTENSEESEVAATSTVKKRKSSKASTSSKASKNSGANQETSTDLLADGLEGFDFDADLKDALNKDLAQSSAAALERMRKSEDFNLYQGHEELNEQSAYPDEFVADDDDDYDDDELASSADSNGGVDSNGKKINTATKAPTKRLGAPPRKHKGNHLGSTTIKSKGTRNLNSNYILLQKLASTPTTGPIDGRRKRDSLPELGKGQYRRATLPQTFEIRRYIDTVATFLERDREQMFSALISMCSNHGRLKTIYGDNYKRFNLNDARFEDLWLNLETMDQPCMVLYLGSSIEVRPHNTKRSIYNAKNANYNFVVLDGLDFRIGNVPKPNRKRRVSLTTKNHLNSTLIPTKSADDNLDNPNAHFNIIKEELLSPYELIYIKL